MYNNDLTSEDNLKFQFTKSGTQYGYKNSSGTFIPFKNPTGTRSITTNGTYDVTNYASAYVSVSTSLSETTLWTNSSPTSNFANQTVNLSGNLSNYKYIRVYWRLSTGTATESSVIMAISDFIKSKNSNNPYMALGCRLSSPTKRGVIYASDTSVSFQSAVNDLGQVSNLNVIPIKICGCN